MIENPNATPPPAQTGGLVDIIGLILMVFAIALILIPGAQTWLEKEFETTARHESRLRRELKKVMEGPINAPDRDQNIMRLVEQLDQIRLEAQQERCSQLRAN